MIQASDISVIVQGPVVSAGGQGAAEETTAACVSSIRKHLPGARLILSTWKGADLSGLDIDECIESEDPGGLLDKQGIRYNVNRQLLSTRAGLARVTTPHAVKMRSDCRLVHAGFLDLFQRHRERAAELEVFQDRLVCSDLYFRTPHKEPHALLFHPSDVFQFGNTSDLRLLWNVDPARSEDIHLPSPSSVPWLAREDWRSQIRLAEEQYLWLACLEKAGHSFHLRYSWEFSPELIRASELSIINNFVPASEEQLGVILPARFHANGPEAVYSYADFVQLCELHCFPKTSDKMIDHRIKSLHQATRNRRLAVLRRRLKSLLKGGKRKP